MESTKKENIKMTGIWKFTLRDINTGKERIYIYKNIIPTVARTMIANNLVDSSPDNSLLISHIALGTGVTAPANGDTTLETETYRNAVASKTNGNNIAYITGFFTATEVTGSLKEAGVFTDASGTPDSGILLSRVAIDVTKSNTETLTIDWTLTVS